LEESWGRGGVNISVNGRGEDDEREGDARGNKGRRGARKGTRWD
jgi:hypothetical protein